VLRDDVDLIEGGQGTAIRQRTAARLDHHLGRVFEGACRARAALLVRDGELPGDMIIGRWWRDEIAEIDVLGISADRTALLGECRWQTAPLTSRDVLELQRKVSFVPEPAADIRLLFWTRTGAAEPGFPARAYSAADIVG
jgi:uncharacterized protein